MKEDQELELTILMPCLNESDTIGTCVNKAKKALEDNNIYGEVLVVDNGSSDNSKEIAEHAGARVTSAPIKGYGSALNEGIKQAYGKYCIIGDSDGSYDFSNIMPFLEKLRDGYDLVIGNRFKGGIEKGAMPWSHRYIGTPIISFLGKLFYRCEINDFNSGMRGLNRQAILKLDLKCTGMEYASEMIVQANLNKLKIAEIPIKLYKDGRKGQSHLKSFSDGWRHLKFLLMYSPKWLFLIPGTILMLIGLVGTIALFFRDIQLGSIVLGIHSRLYFGAMVVVGFQMIVFSIFAKIYAINSGMNPKSSRMATLLNRMILEKWLIIGFFLTIIGIGLTIYAMILWQMKNWGNLDPAKIMPITIPAVYLIIIGVQMSFASFILGILNIEYKREK